MKLLWRIGREAIKYKRTYFIAIFSVFALTAINLIAPGLLSQATALVSAGVDETALQSILVLTLALAGLYLLRILFRYLSNILAHRAAWHLVEDLRQRVYDKIQGLSLGFFHDRQTGDLMSRVVNDTATFELLYAHIIPEMITNVIILVGVMTVLMTINWKLALLTCIPIPFILVSGWIFAKKIRPHFRVAQSNLADINAKIQDNLSGIHEIQSFGREVDETAAVTGRLNRYTKSILKALQMSAAFHPIVEFLSALGTIIVVGIGGFLAFQNELNVADIVAFLLYLSLFYAPITHIAQLLENTQQAYAGAERVVAVLDEEEEIKDKPDAIELTDVKGAISFEHVNFAYEDDNPVLVDVNFSCEPGQMVALVGPTGVGKTTLTQLLSRFYEPDSGEIYIDGVDISDVTVESLRRHIAPVLQDTYLFNGTIAENIGYSAPNSTREQVVEAAKAACIHETIMEMPNGYDTEVGERGVRLSGGQKQRIAIARAILRGSPIIILDEATASVDTQTEREIQTAINDLAKSKTIVAIAHRLSTIRRADLILVLDEGKVVQRGTHEELSAQEGLYRELYRVQA